MAPLWTGTFLPFTDLPEHVAAIATLAAWGDPASAVHGVYDLALSHSQYLLYHLLGAGLARLFHDALLGHRVLLTLVGLAFPYSMRSLLSACGKDPRLALLAGVPFWSRSLVVGFLPYLASIPLTLFTLAQLTVWLRTPTRKGTVVLVLCALCTFFLHLNSFVLLALVSVAFALLLPGQSAPTRATMGARLRAMPLRLAWFVPAAVAAVAFSSRMSLARGSGGLTGEVDYLPKRMLAREFPIWAHDVWLSHQDEWTALGFWLLVLFLGISRAPTRRTSWQVLTSWTPFAATAILFMLMPFTVGAGTMLNVRLATYFGLFVLLVVELPEKRTKLMTRCAVLLTVAVSITAIVQIRAAQAELGRFDRILAAMKPERKLLGLGFLETSKVSPFFPWIHVGGYYRAHGGLVASVSFSELRHWPIRYRPEATPPSKSQPFWEFDPCLFRNQIDGAYYDYVLTRGTIDPFRDAPPGPTWRKEVREGDFTLYEKTGATSPAWAVEDRGPCESRRSLEHAL